MAQRKLFSLGRSLWISSLAITASLLPTPHPTLAQNISFDGTLGEAATLNGPTYVIRPGFGQTVGNNLFHSFRQFNLNTGETALFQSSAGIQNILSRVTGGTPSSIDGLIRTASANVNLYLINPNGILFGPNASLDVGGVGRGAFIATTTDALVWGNDPNRQFSATNPGGPSSLLTLVGDPSGFLASQRRPGGISITDVGDPSDLGLAVASEKRLLLLGGDVQLNGGVIRAEGGRVEIGAVSGAGVVGLDLNTAGVSLQIPETMSRADILLDRSYIITNSRESDGGDIAFQARNITLRNATQLQAATFGAGDAGDVLLTASESISLESDSIIFSTLEEGGQGKGGNIVVRTPLLTMSGGAQLQTAVKKNANGVAGIIFVETDGGDVVLSGRSTVTGLPTLMASSIAEGASNTFSGGDFAGNVFDALLGETDQEITGSVFISTGTLTMTNGARLDSSTFGNSNAGAVIVLADEISLSSRSVISSVVGQQANGDGGGIVIGTSQLAINGADTGLTTSTVGNGDAGLIFVVARDRISSDGAGSGIFSSVTPESTGAAGGIVLGARSLVLRNGAEINVSNEGTGAAGAIFINALATFLDQDSQISATTRSGQGGDINLNVAFVSLYRSSSISTNADTARLASGVQPGGNIRIQGLPRFGFDRTIAITAKPGRDSNIVAKAFRGRGGDINIFAGRLLGIRQRPEVFVTNDIDASSEFGANGFVTVSLLDVDPERGTVPLADDLADASQLIAEGCDTRGKLARGRFTNGGRGGLPPAPNDVLADDDVMAEWVEPNQPVMNSQDGTGGSNSDVQATDVIKNSSEIIEAQGWQINPDGTVVLVAQALEAPLPIPWLAPSSCRVP